MAVPLLTVHPAGVEVVVTLSVLFDWVMVTVSVFMHPLASVTVTVWVPDESPVAVCVVCPLFQV